MFVCERVSLLLHSHKTSPQRTKTCMYISVSSALCSIFLKIWNTFKILLWVSRIIPIIGLNFVFRRMIEIIGSSISLTEKDIDTRLPNAWTAINRLSSRWKSDLTDKMKCSFFQAAVVSILLYGCTTWTLTKRLEKKKIDGNYTRMLQTILIKSWRQHPTGHQLYGYLSPITKTIQVRRIRHAGHCWRNKDELISDVLLWTPHIWPSKNWTTSSNIHTPAMWGYGM